MNISSPGGLNVEGLGFWGGFRALGLRVQGFTEKVGTWVQED